MNGNQDTTPSKDIPRPSGLDLGYDKFFRETLKYVGFLGLPPGGLVGIRRVVKLMVY